MIWILRPSDAKVKLLLLLALIVVALSCTPVQGQSDNPVSPIPLVLSDAQNKYPLGLHLDILEDPSGELSIEDVSSPEFDAQFVRSQVEVPNFGFTDSAYWVRYTLNNESEWIDDLLLEVGFANMHFVDLYTPLPNGEGFSVRQSGALRPPAIRDIEHPRIVFDVALPPQSQQTVYLRFRNGASMTLPLILWTPDAFASASLREHTLRGLFFGALLILLIYNLFLFISLRDRAYLFLSMLLASTIIFEANYSGYTEVYLFPQFYALREYYQALSLALTYISFGLFTDAFLDLGRQRPRIHWLILAIVVAWTGFIVLTPFADYYWQAMLGTRLTLLSLLTYLGIGITSWLRGDRYARLFVLAAAGFPVLFGITALARAGVIASTTVTEEIYHLGLLWLVAGLSFALADRINILKAETETANRALHESEVRLSQILEGLPLGVVVYGPDQMLRYANERMAEILSNPDRGISLDLLAERPLTDVLEYYSLKIAGTDQSYPLDDVPVHRALRGEPASVDDAEVDLADRRVPLEIWANPVKDQDGRVESAVVAVHDITRRRALESERDEYRSHLENLVAQRTAERHQLASVQGKLTGWLSEIGRAQQSVGGPSDLPEVYEQLLDTILRMVEAERVFTCMWDGHDGQAEMLCCLRSGESSEMREPTSVTLPSDVSPRRDLEQDGLLIIPTNRSSHLLAPLASCLDNPAIRSVVLAPMESDSMITGLMGVGLQRTTDELSDEEIFLLGRMGSDLAALADYAGLVESAKLLAAADERNRLARDLHDSVTQVLFSATLVAEVLPTIWRKDPDRAANSLENLRRLTYSALAELRTMLLELRPSAVLNMPLSELLAQLTEAITSRSSLTFQLLLEQTPPLSEEVHMSFYRIAQESLNNVVKHAQADYVTVSLGAKQLTPDSNGVSQFSVEMVIYDDGIGYSPDSQHPGHLGVGIMNERAAAIDAQLVLEGQPGKGTRMCLVWVGSPLVEGNQNE